MSRVKQRGRDIERITRACDGDLLAVFSFRDRAKCQCNGSVCMCECNCSRCGRCAKDWMAMPLYIFREVQYSSTTQDTSSII